MILSVALIIYVVGLNWLYLNKINAGDKFDNFVNLK